MTTRLVIGYALRDGVSRASYERWVRDEDAPYVRGRPTVSRFEVYRVDRVLEGATDMDYVEVVEVVDLAADQALLAEPPGAELDAAWRVMTRDAVVLEVSRVAGSDEASDARWAHPDGEIGSSHLDGSTR